MCSKTLLSLYWLRPFRKGAALPLQGGQSRVWWIQRFRKASANEAKDQVGRTIPTFRFFSIFSQHNRTHVRFLRSSSCSFAAESISTSLSSSSGRAGGVAPGPSPTGPASADVPGSIASCKKITLPAWAYWRLPLGSSSEGTYLTVGRDVGEQFFHVLSAVELGREGHVGVIDPAVVCHVGQDLQEHRRLFSLFLCLELTTLRSLGGPSNDCAIEVGDWARVQLGLWPSRLSRQMDMAYYQQSFFLNEEDKTGRNFSSENISKSSAFSQLKSEEMSCRRQNNAMLFLCSRGDKGEELA